MRILFGGDFYLGDKNNFLHNYKDSLKELKKIRDTYDLFFLNLEGLISDEYENSTLNGIKLINSKKTISVLKFLNVSGVFLSNNHTMDFPSVLSSTIGLLESNNIMVLGAGSLDKLKGTTFKVKNISVTIAGFSEDIGRNNDYATETKSSYFLFNDNSLKKVLSEKSDLFFVYIHHGLMREYYPTPELRELLHLNSNSSTFFIGSHAHHVMGIEEDKFVYGLGDLFFKNFINEENKFIYKNFKKSNYTFLVGYSFDKEKLISKKIHPLYKNSNEILISSKQVNMQVEKKIERLSKKWNNNYANDFEKNCTRDNGVINFFRYEVLSLTEYIFNIIRFKFKYEFIKSPGFRKIEIVNKLVKFLRK